ncbi:MAG: hypothetical protein ACK5AZ_05650 [Bryobacteraceae bacterium]
MKATTAHLALCFAIGGSLITGGCQRSDTAPAVQETAAVAEEEAASTPTEQAPTSANLTPAPARPAAPRTSPAPAAPAAPPAPRVSTLTLASGTPISVRTTTTLSTKNHNSGDSFVASLAEPLIADGRVIAPRGATVTGRVASSDPGGRVKGVASIAVELTGIEVGGRTVEIATSVVEREAPTSKKKDAAKVGIGAGVGAAIGAIAGGGKGAAIGAGAGAGAGTATVLATRGDPAVIPSESVLSFTLRAPVSVTSSH